MSDSNEHNQPPPQGKESQVSPGIDFLTLVDAVAKNPLPALEDSGFPSVHPTDKRRNPDGSRKFVIQEIHAQQHAIARLSALGLRHKDIAEAVGCTPQTVSNTINSPVVKELIAELNILRDENVLEQSKHLADLAPLAIRELQEAFDENSDLTQYQRVKAAQDLLNRVGHGVVHKIHAEVIHAEITMEDILDIKERAKQNASKAGILPLEVSAEVV